MIDLNNHLLGEDGSEVSPGRALESCEEAWRDGFREIVVTCRSPWQRGTPTESLAGVSLFEQRLTELRRMVEAHSAVSQLKLFGGYEWKLTTDLPERLQDFPAAPTINGSCWLLLSLPALQPLPGANEVLDQLRAAGWRLIIAHPECSRVVRRDRTLLNRLVAEGALIQLDASSILGGYGREVEKFGLDLLERNQVHFIATRTNHRSRSQVQLKEACARAARLVGRPAAQALVHDNPLEILRQSAESPALLSTRRWRAMEAALG
jgi:protein-tyrosine phosphatase